VTSGPLTWDLAQVGAAVGGTVQGDPRVAISSVVTDSRLAQEGSLFVARVGEVQDGHGHAAAALAAGAAAVLVAAGRGVAEEPRVEVADTAVALRDLAVQRRRELEIPVVAITGSTGKTSTKDLLAAALGSGAWASPQSFNNEVGVPLTILSTPDEATALVAEVGSRGRGHIAWLAPALRPDVAVITNIGVVHLETFGTPENLLAGKWELIESLDPGGTAVVPAGDSRLHRAVPGRRVTFGTEEDADVRVSQIRLDRHGRPEFWVDHNDERAHVALQHMAGVHQAHNAAAAVAAALALERPLGEVAAAMAAAHGSAWRMDVHPGWFTVVNDSYNANPDSVAAALHTVAVMPGRSIAVLGIMAELGEAAVAEHRRIGRLAAGAGSVAVAVPDLAAAEQVVLTSVADGDVVLVKASRVVGLERLASRLIDQSGLDRRAGDRSENDGADREETPA
jgi:UDP-N-acetylmuramoyl-tripeptide--D-alanyl-D-alanine ligase